MRGALEVASDKEIASLEKHVVYELVPITSVPAGQRVVGRRWVNKIKADGTYRGRLAERGQSQVPGIDCNGTFSPVCRLQSIRMMLAIAAKDNEVFMLDFHTAFLNADVEEDIFVNMVPGDEIAAKPGVPLVMKLAKSLHGLRKSPKNCFGTMDHHLAEIGSRPLKSDPVFTYARMTPTLSFVRCTWTTFFYWEGTSSC